jgi:tRNA wybutosine-synthesizing protein 3
MRLMMDAWQKKKEAFLNRIERDKEIGYLDVGIEETLKLVNSRDKSFTTSSCTGRVSAVDSQFPWKREEEPPIFKKHGEVTAEELKMLLEIRPNYVLWLTVSGPIIHVSCRDLEEAEKILEAGRAAGFKHSGIMSLSKDSIMVELISGTHLYIPLRTKNKVFFSEDSMPELLSLVNTALLEGKERLKRLNNKLRELLIEEKENV